MATEVPAARIVMDPADRAEIVARVEESLRTGSLTLGPHTREFEQAFAGAHRAPHAVAVSSGTSALEIVLRAVGVAGRDVIVPADTFAATAYAVQAAGGTPVFADVDEDTFALSPETVDAAWTPDTAAVVTVHIGGLISPVGRGGGGAGTAAGGGAGRGRRACPRLDTGRPVRRLVRGRRNLLLLPDQGDHQR
jgi:perosamine synthetase